MDKPGPWFLWLLVLSFLLVLLTALVTMWLGLGDMHTRAVALLSMMAEWPVVAAILAGGAALKFGDDLSVYTRSRAEALRTGSG